MRLGSARSSFAGPRSPVSFEQHPRASCPYCCETLEPLCDGDQPPSGYRFLGSSEDDETAASASEVCRRCRISFDPQTSSPDISVEDRQRVLLAGYRARRARDRFRMGRGERHDAVSELAEAFACLRGVVGVRPFCAQELHAWACAHPRDASLRDCIAFVLHVADAGARWSFAFDAVAAMRRWDAPRRAVFLEWARRPWWA